MVVKNITRLYYHVWYLNCLFTLVCGEVDLKIKIILLVEREREINEKNTELGFAHGTEGGAVPELPE